MIRRLLPVCSLLLVASGLPFAFADEPADRATFEGIWLGEIAAPGTTAEFGLAFTTTPRGQLVSVYFPEMFLYSANFGPAEFRERVFHLRPLDLVLRREGDQLVGTFAPAGLPVVLRRNGTFRPEPTLAELPAAPAPVWRHALGAPAWASPIAHEGVIYVGTTDGAMHAVTLDGRPLWRWQGPHPLYGDATVTEDGVYFIDERNELVALARATGTFRWRLPLRATPAPGAPGSDPTFNHRTAAPIADTRGLLYVGSVDGAVLAVRARTGKPAWRKPVGTPVHAAVSAAANDLYVAGFDGSVLRLDRRTQNQLMRVKLPGPVVSTAILAGDKLIVGCRDTMLYALNSRTGKIEWRVSYWFSWVESTPRLADGVLYIGGSDYRRVSAVDPATGRRAWSTDVRGLSWGTPAVTLHSVYAGTAGQNIAGTVLTHEGGIVALDRATGAVKWRHGAPAPAGAKFTGFAGSPVVAGGRVICAGIDGTLVAFPAD